VATHFRMGEIRRSHVRLDASGASPDPCASAHSAEMHVYCLHWRPNECGKDDFLRTSPLTSAPKKIVELPKEGAKLRLALSLSECQYYAKRSCCQVYDVWIAIVNY